MSATATRSRMPLLCLLNLHHQWKKQYNPAGEMYKHCQRCGKDHMGDVPRGTPKRPMPWGI